MKLIGSGPFLSSC